jgi:hypothetical protein
MLRAELKVHNAQLDAERAQTRAQGWELRAEWDYTPRTFVWMVIFDFPAILAVEPFGIAHATLSRPLFPLFAGFLWYWCGRGLERRLARVNETRSRPGIVASVLNGVGLICALALEISVLWSGPGGTGSVLAVVGWCTTFAVYFGARLARRWLPATWPPQERTV